MSQDALKKFDALLNKRAGVLLTSICNLQATDDLPKPKTAQRLSPTHLLDDFPTGRRGGMGARVEPKKSQDDGRFSEGVKSHQQNKLVPPLPNLQAVEGY